MQVRGGALVGALTCVRGRPALRAVVEDCVKVANALHRHRHDARACMYKGILPFACPPATAFEG